MEIHLESEVTFAQSTDVVVVGFGGAGACAALQAVESGARVVAIDRFEGGGATAISGGVVYAGGGTHIQREAGLLDDAGNMARYLKHEVGDVVSDEILRDFCEQSVQSLSWLEGHGVPFEASLCPIKTSYPTDDYYLYYSGNESFAPYTDDSTPVARGHRAKGAGLPGASFYDPLKSSALRSGVELISQAQVRGLVQDDSDRIVGVAVYEIESKTQRLLHRQYARLASNIKNYVPNAAKRAIRICERIEKRHAVCRFIRAERGVVLSAGGFIYNREMVKEYAEPYRRGMPLGTPGCDGSGIQLGEAAGGQTDRMHRVSAWRFINPPEAWVEGILVNRHGERYVNERLYGARIGELMVDDNDGDAFLIIDQATWKKSRDQVSGNKVQWFQKAPALMNLYANCKKGATIAELARNSRLDPDGLARTVDTYNAAARGEVPDAFGKSKDYIQPLTSGPYFAINCSIYSKRFPCPTLTLGGLIVDQTTGNVRTADGTNIDGLYAAGRTAVGVASNRYVSGLSLADCVYSGRRAGRVAAMQQAAEGSGDS